MYKPLAKFRFTFTKEELQARKECEEHSGNRLPPRPEPAAEQPLREDTR